MKKRLLLMWLALTASETAVNNQVVLIISKQQRDYAKSIAIELGNTRIQGRWTVEGTSIGYHSDKFNTNACHRFMRHAPDYVDRLTRIIRGFDHNAQ